MSISTGLYIHIPWCVKKCPYCDFNSHELRQNLDEKNYINALIEDFEKDVSTYPKTKIDSIFIGGGTPSLFSAESYATLFEALKNILPWSPKLEITIEANPGTIDSERFKDYRALGINRISIGIQSFQDSFLKKLGRIHDAKAAYLAIDTAHLAGFQDINLDLMYGLPGQTPHEALFDLNEALKARTNHLSWYELTIEPNTLFYKHPPKQPTESVFIEIETRGHALLAANGFKRYEISAFGKEGGLAKHNLNYWHFGDYYGIGAGAHGKLTHANQIIRTTKVRQPGSYLKKEKIAEIKAITAEKDIIFEFMLNACRLIDPIPTKLFQVQTGLDGEIIQPYLHQAEESGLIQVTKDHWQLTPKGLQFNNELMQLFLT